MDTERCSEQERNCGLLKNKMYYPTSLTNKKHDPVTFLWHYFVTLFSQPLFFLPHQFFMPLPSPRGGDQRVKEIHQCLLKSLAGS